MKINLKDNLVIGFLSGLIGPSIGIIGFYLVNFGSDSVDAFLDASIKGKLMSPLLSLCCVINLGIFYLYIQFDKYLSARGVILSTFLYGFIIVLLKFFL
ncbi:MAG: hypothetical protein CFE21_12385 [Bacteroidetes bacterium B1(2017)]|nr:MAG: hypothetical protein CFE21_12385 [Bacteroidetes bacterium B1(2017)]